MILIHTWNIRANIRGMFGLGIQQQSETSLSVQSHLIVLFHAKNPIHQHGDLMFVVGKKNTRKEERRETERRQRHGPKTNAASPADTS